MVTVVIRILCTKGSVPDRSAHSIGILGRTVLYFCGDFISGSSGTVSGYKGLKYLITSKASIRRRIEDMFHAVTNYLNGVLVCSNLGLNHLTRTEALTHHTAYTKALFGNKLSIIWSLWQILGILSLKHAMYWFTYPWGKRSVFTHTATNMPTCATI